MKCDFEDCCNEEPPFLCTEDLDGKTFVMGRYCVYRMAQVHRETCREVVLLPKIFSKVADFPS